MSRKLAIITGTSSGIGNALAHAMLDSGWQVVGIARSPVGADSAEYRHIRHDLGDMAGLDALLATLRREISTGSWSRLALVNNAATEGGLRSVENLDPESFHATLALNLTVPVALMGLCRSAWPKDKPLRIINVSSGSARGPMPGVADYCASKAGLRLAGQVVALEAEGDDVAVLSFEPGIVATPMQDRARAESPEDFPAVHVFREFYECGLLTGAAEVTPPMVEFAQTDGISGFYESRFGEN